MKLSVPLVSILLWVFLTPVAPSINGRFFLELAKPSIDTTKLIKMVKNGEKEEGSEGDNEPFTIRLYECRRDLKSDSESLYVVACRQIGADDTKRDIYKVANFNGVSNLEFALNMVVKMDGQDVYLNNKIPEALAIGIDPRNFYVPEFKPAPANKNHVKNKVSTLLDRLVDLKEKPDLWWQFFSINVPTYFEDHKTTTPILFDRFVTALQKLIDASGYNKLRSPASSHNKNKSTTTVTGRLRSPSRSLCKALGQTLFRSRSQTKLKIPSWCWSRLRSSSSSWSRSSAKSPSRFPSSLSPSRSQPLSESDILEIAGLLIFRMFDPCFVQWTLESDEKTAERHCTTYCQFISATIHVYGRQVSDKCHNLRKGSCYLGMCLCQPRRDHGLEEVSMLYCNNAVRLHIYQQAAYTISPKLGERFFRLAKK